MCLMDFYYHVENEAFENINMFDFRLTESEQMCYQGMK